MTDGSHRVAGEGRDAPARPAARGEAGALGRVLARAFREDPIHRWVFPEDSQWRRGSHRLFATLVRDLTGRETALTCPGLAGAALWYDPESPKPGIRAWIEVAAVTLWSIRGRTRLVTRGLDELERRRPKERHWYLSVLGTDPSHQGRGVGSALMAPTLARCDAEGVLAYLESSRPENVPFYERHGFVVTEEIPMPEGPSAWGMRREPRHPSHREPGPR